MADLPTDRNTHFFDPIKKLSAKNKKFVRVISIFPLLEGNETREEFWQKHCGLSEASVDYKHFPIRKAFLQLQDKPREAKTFSFSARIGNREERELLEKSCARGSVQVEIDDGQAKFFIASQDFVVTILLGSKPTHNATLDYIRKFIELARDPACIQRPIHIFACCSHHTPGSNSLLKQAADLVEQTADYPRRLSVIPLSFQQDETIASLFFRSDLTCTRSGGQTAMELMCLMQGEIWVHSEARCHRGDISELPMDELLRGIPGWEAGSALYLHRARNARIITPGHMKIDGRRVLCRGKQANPV